MPTSISNHAEMTAAIRLQQEQDFPENNPQPQQQLPRLPFPPLKKSHILNCSYRAVVPKTRIIPLPSEFIDYLRADGIFLPGDEKDSENEAEDDDDDDDEMDEDEEGGVNGGMGSQFRRELDRISAGLNGAATNGKRNGTTNGHSTSTAEVKDGEEEEAAEAEEDGEEEEEEVQDPTSHFKDLHNQIKSTIYELGGKVAPKLDWSAPKDSAWISPTNSLECRNPSDIYLLLKSSDFITHDLEHAFDGTVDDTPQTNSASPFQFSLVLRKWFDINPSVEFRCFVRDRTLLAITQRDLNHYDFLEPMRDDLVDLIRDFFDEKLKDQFPDPDFTFDVYIPRPQSRVWLIDINPFAQRTDPILFSWLEILSLNISAVREGSPELRLVRKNDPEAYSFNSPQYSAHKLPKEVVDAGLGGASSIQEFAERWRDIVNNMPDS